MLKTILKREIQHNLYSLRFILALALVLGVDLRQEFPAVMGRNYLLAEIEGCGHYVGTVLNVRQLTASWWGEGDDFFFIDGAKTPQLRGTGSEDYLCDGWGLRKMSNPYYGCPLMEGYDPYALTTAYRWHIPDPVAFHKDLKLTIQALGWWPNGRYQPLADDIASVAYWYQAEPHLAFPPFPPLAQRWPR